VDKRDIPPVRPAGLDSELDSALRAMEAGFHVRLISTFDPELICAPPEKDAADWLELNYPEFDQFPVRENGGTIGVLLRGDKHKSRIIREAMRPLRDGLVVSTHMPIGDLIPQLRHNHFRLVLRDHNINGLVTQSDLVKLPVRMLVFGFISHFELLLRALIRRRHVQTEWMDALGRDGQRFDKGKLAKLKSQRLELDPLELTLFTHALEVLSKAQDIGNDLSADTTDIVNLRNDIAHARSFITSPEDVRVFVDRFEKLRAWIDRVTTLLGKAA
jgi:CBS domain